MFGKDGIAGDFCLYLLSTELLLMLTYFDFFVWCAFIVVEGNNKLVNLPTEIGRLSRLERLDLGECTDQLC